jgi:uncharacterized protein
MIASRLSFRLATVFLLLCLAGCAGSGPTRFYVLQSLAEQQAIPKSSANISVGVGPVVLPDYLDRSQIVTRDAPGTLKLAEFDRWAGRLDKNFGRVLAENLSILLATDKVAVFPWPGSLKPDYQVAVEVTRFDGALNGKVSLAARYRVLGGDGKEVLVTRKAEVSEGASGPSYEELVAAQCRAVANLSREIASAIESIPERKAN